MGPATGVEWYVEEYAVTSGSSSQGRRADSPPEAKEHRVELGDQMCPRCRKLFTVSYWSGDTMVQARCLSCDLKWPRPDVV